MSRSKIYLTINEKDNAMVEVWDEDNKVLYGVVHQDLFFCGDLYNYLDDNKEAYVELNILDE